MKLAMVTTSVSCRGGGVAAAVTQLATRLAESGDNVRVFSFALSGAPVDGAQSNIAGLALFKPHGPTRFPFSWEMARALSTWSPGLIHVHNLWQFPSILAWRAKRHLRIPTMITPHGALEPGSLRVSGVTKRLAAWIFENRHLRAADCLHALSDAEAQSFRRYGLTGPICVIPNGAVIPEALSEERPPWNGCFEGGRRVVLAIGRFHPIKGLPNVLQAWARVKETMPETRAWALVLAGWDADGHEYELRELVGRLGLHDDVAFIGPVFDKEKTAAFLHSEAVIAASISEGLPAAVLDGWAHSKPVLMTPACNLPIGFDRNAAIRVEPTVVSIAKGLQELLSMSTAGRVAMGRRGLDLVRERFTWARAGAELKAVYAWLQGTGPQPNCVLPR